jgi:hypothetical protein
VTPFAWTVVTIDPRRAQNCQRVAPYGSAVATPNTVWAATR